MTVSFTIGEAVKTTRASRSVDTTSKKI